MTSIRELQRLQSLDTGLSSRQKRLDDVQRLLEDTEALEELRAAAADARRDLTEMENSQRSAEWEVDSIRQQVATIEKKLYSGEVKNPKELVSIQEEVSLLKKRQSEHEDTLLGIMNKLEEAQRRHQEASAGLAEAETERAALEERLSAERTQLEEEVRVLQGQREQVATEVPAQDMRLYASLLTTKQGKAVAGVERSMCQGCRLNIPLNIQQRLRANHGLVQCPSCNRILYPV